MELAQIMPLFLAVVLGITVLIVTIPFVYITVASHVEYKSWKKELGLK